MTWYVTPLDPETPPARNVSDTAEGTVEPEVVADGIRKLLKVYPALGDRAGRPDSGVEFAVYAGLKQDIGREKNRAVCRPLEGLDNVIVALPSLIPGAFVSAARAMKLVADRIRPSAASPAPLPPDSSGPVFGEVSENESGIEWMSWSRLKEVYPGIDGPSR